VRILLPPSEAKHPGGRGKPLSARAGLRAIDQVRQRTLGALAELVRLPYAAEALLLPPSIAREALHHNAVAATSRTRPAVERYAGVVYDGLAVSELSDGARKAAQRSLLIFSGLFGVLRGDEAVPVYRVPAKAQLPGLGVAGTFWKQHLGEVLPSLLGAGLIVDLRSTDYASMWQPARQDSARQRLVAVRVLSHTPAGGYGVISYSSKLGKGKLAAALLERRAAGLSVATVDDVADAWRAIGGSAARERQATVGVGLDLFD
jgi:cytoplasmic iron level regulating protein YaaA (DUF328/UPF0246 family)